MEEAAVVSPTVGAGGRRATEASGEMSRVGSVRQERKWLLAAILCVEMRGSTNENGRPESKRLE